MKKSSKNREISKQNGGYLIIGASFEPQLYKTPEFIVLAWHPTLDKAKSEAKAIARNNSNNRAFVVPVANFYAGMILEKDGIIKTT